MKTREKIALGVSVILAITVAVGATSTYAWYRTSRNALVNITDAEITGEGANLSIAYNALPDSGSLAHNSLNNGFEVSAAMNSITDVSGDGARFYKPNWSNPKGGIANSIHQVSNEDLNTYYIRFGISFINGGLETFNIYLNDKTKLTPVTATGTDEAFVAAQQARNDQSAKSTRLAFWDDGATTLLSLWQPDLTDGDLVSDYHYLSPEIGGTAYAAEGKTTDFTLVTPDPDSFHLGSFAKLTEKPTSLAPGQFLVTVPAISTVKIEFGLWIEGTLSLAKSEEVGGQINVALGFIAF